MAVVVVSRVPLKYFSAVKTSSSPSSVLFWLKLGEEERRAELGLLVLGGRERARLTEKDWLMRERYVANESSAARRLVELLVVVVEYEEEERAAEAMNLFGGAIGDRFSTAIYC